MAFIVKTLIAAFLISFCSWLAGKKPYLAGFIIALPVPTLLALLFTQLEFGNASASYAFARSIFVAIPVSLLFFLPFLFAGRLHIPFWGSYCLGLLLLAVGFFVHRAVFQY